VPEHGVWVSEARGLPAMVRASPHYLTTDEELDALLEVVEHL
jgi:selenocysteine lyase/cysteine desulfurase